MIYYTKKNKSLLDIILNKSKHILCDEICILSGYIGINPIELLSNTKGIKIKIVFGLAKEGVSEKLLNQLKYLHTSSNKTVSIFCPNILSHAKLYLWKNKGEVVYGLNGSANFSSNGLLTEYRELLSEVNKEDFFEFKEYFDVIYESSDPIISINKVNKNIEIKNEVSDKSAKYGTFITSSLFGEKSKINWGHSPKGHTNPQDAYIPIKKSDILDYPDLFPAKSNNKGIGYTDNEPIDVIWDDGVNMICLMEGSMEIGGIRYPNKISTYKDKKILGDYLRNRMNIAKGKFVTKDDFVEYGRDNISISKINDGVYYFDFNPKIK